MGTHTNEFINFAFETLRDAVQRHGVTRAAILGALDDVFQQIMTGRFLK